MKPEDFNYNELELIYESKLKVPKIFIKKEFTNLLGGFVYKSLKHELYKQKPEKLNLTIKILSGDFDIDQIYTEEQKRNNFIHYASKGLDSKIISLLIHKKCDLNSFNNSYKTPLMIALDAIVPTDKKHLKAFKILLEAQTDIDICNYQYKTAFQFILDKTIRLVRQAIANDTQNNPLHVTNNYLKICSLMIQHGADIKKYKYSSNITTDKNLFNVAIDLNSELLFNFLVESGLDINHKSIQNDNLPILYASEKVYGLPYVKKILGISNSLINIKDDDSNPVINAIKFNHFDIVKELIDFPVPYNLKTAFDKLQLKKNNVISFYIINKNIENIDEIERILSSYTIFVPTQLIDMVSKIKFSQKMEQDLSETGTNKKLKL